jgi:hypothetical protein
MRRSFDDLKELGTEQAVKGAGKYRQQGKEYVVNDGDIIYFKVSLHSVAAAGLPTESCPPHHTSMCHIARPLLPDNAQFNVTSSGKK